MVIESLMLSQLAAARPLWGAATIFGFLLSAGIGELVLTIIVLQQGSSPKLFGWLAVGLTISLALLGAPTNNSGFLWRSRRNPGWIF